MVHDLLAEQGKPDPELQKGPTGFTVPDLTQSGALAVSNHRRMSYACITCLSTRLFHELLNLWKACCCRLQRSQPLSRSLRSCRRALSTEQWAATTSTHAAVGATACLSSRLPPLTQPPGSVQSANSRFVTWREASASPRLVLLD